MNSVKKIVLISLCLFFSLEIIAQYVPNGFFYQTIVRNSLGGVLQNQAISLRFTIQTNGTNPVNQWQEVHQATTSNIGYIKVIIGKGTTTGVGTALSFSDINWAYSNKLIAEIDISGGSNFAASGVNNVFAVPYAFVSNQTDSLVSISFQNFSDVNTASAVPGMLLKYNGNEWIPATDNSSDTVSYALNAGNVITTASANYVVNHAVVDTVQYAQSSGFSNNSNQSNFSAGTINANQSDTALYALTTLPHSWKTDGNVVTNKIVGSLNNAFVSLKTNNTERLKLNAAGGLSIGSVISTADLSHFGNDGILVPSTGTVNVGTASGAGTKLIWYPYKKSFRVGGIDGNQWDTTNTGIYSASFGYNCEANDYSISAGYDCKATDYSFAIGRKSEALGVGAYPTGNCIAIGDSNLSVGVSRSVTIGRGNYCSVTSTPAIGAYNIATANVALALGYKNIASGSYSSVIGYRANSNAKSGCFVYSDASTNTDFSATATNQFLIRASGGIVFYTDIGNSNAVVLNPGSGSWANVSDRNKKENFKSVDENDILNKVTELKIQSWNYKTQNKNIRHIGPTAQSFYNKFNLGESNKKITETDIDGIIICCIKSLYKQYNTIENSLEISDINNSLNKASSDFNQIENRLQKIESSLNSTK
jgi:Chaperone of endosialidase